MNPIQVPEDILMQAVRYALGRDSYAVTSCISAVKRAWPSLTPGARGCIERDVRNNLAWQREMNWAPTVSTNEWESLLAWIGAQAVSA